MPVKKSILWYLSFLASLLVVFVAAFGLAEPSIYKAKLNSISLAELLGQDLVSLLIGKNFYSVLDFLTLSAGNMIL